MQVMKIMCEIQIKKKKKKMASTAYEREISGGAVFDGELRTVTYSASKVIGFAQQSL